MALTQVQLTEEQASALEALAARRGVSVAALLQEAAEQVLREDKERRQELWRRALAVVGKYHSGKSDIGVEHDKYLDEDYE